MVLVLGRCPGHLLVPLVGNVLSRRYAWIFGGWMVGVVMDFIMLIVFVNLFYDTVSVSSVVCRASGCLLSGTFRWASSGTRGNRRVALLWRLDAFCRAAWVMVFLTQSTGIRATCR